MEGQSEVEVSLTRQFTGINVVGLGNRVDWIYGSTSLKSCMSVLQEAMQNMLKPSTG